MLFRKKKKVNPQPCSQAWFHAWIKNSQWLKSEKVAWKAESQQSMSSLFRSTLLCHKTMHKKYSFQLCCSDWFNNLSVDAEKHNFMFSKQRVLHIVQVLRSTFHSCERMGFTYVSITVDVLSKSTAPHLSHQPHLVEVKLNLHMRSGICQPVVERCCSVHYTSTGNSLQQQLDRMLSKTTVVVLYVTCFSMSSDNLIKPHTIQVHMLNCACLDDELSQQMTEK